MYLTYYVPTYAPTSGYTCEQIDANNRRCVYIGQPDMIYEIRQQINKYREHIQRNRHQPTKDDYEELPRSLKWLFFFKIFLRYIKF